MAANKYDYFFYIIKCLIGVVIGFYLYRAYPQIGLWCLVSIVLVLSPNRDDALKLAKNRIQANLIGAAIGLALFFIHTPNLFIICIGVILTLIACHLLKLDDVARSAAVSLVIILLHQQGQYFWDVALERAGGVLGGCLIAILLTYIFHIALKRFDV